MKKLETLPSLEIMQKCQTFLNMMKMEMKKPDISTISLIESKSENTFDDKYEKQPFLLDQALDFVFGAKYKIFRLETEKTKNYGIQH